MRRLPAGGPRCGAPGDLGQRHRRSAQPRTEEAEKSFPVFKTIKPYLRTTKQPG